MESIWPGSGSAVSGNTPFALYDNDTTFQSDAQNLLIGQPKDLVIQLCQLSYKTHNFILVLKNLLQNIHHKLTNLTFVITYFTYEDNLQVQISHIKE